MAQAKIQAPIDRPLARAYLREFSGWSTAHPPGVSDATSLRVMHNCSITQEGALRIRPGMRRVMNVPAMGDIVGDFEHFYSTSGRKTLLFAVRDTANNRVVFRTATWNPTTKVFDYNPSIATRFPGATDAGLAFRGDVTFVRYVQIDNKILALSNNDESFRIFWVGSSPKAKVPKMIPVPRLNRETRMTVVHPAAAWRTGDQDTIPTAETKTADTLISSDLTKNVYNFAYCYTFSNEIGETESSQITPVRVQRRWSAWRANTSNGDESEDQLVAYMPETAWNSAVAAGATSWNLYFLTWSDQDSVPVEAVLLKTVDIEGKTYQEAGWASHTPLLQTLDVTRPLPNLNYRDNFTIPSSAGQGLVAGDRLILVYDKKNAARIQWTSNYQGDYLNFSASKGGGFKTLTSGNLYFPAAVKLWQNPSSTDTITVLCTGLDGQGTAYYMNAGSSVSNLTQSTVVMGFEETTATAGTVSPYGCEVLHNALYHPLENNLMKSTASNYNISHKPMADSIQNIWSQIPLKDKQKLVSAQMDSTLYYLVQSPVGWEDGTGHNGNQVWLCDVGKEGAWSCWDVVGTSLRRIEVDGLLYMGIASGPALYVFDPEYDNDDVWDSSTSSWDVEGIGWEIITNTQGANRAHDAWSTLQQVNVTFGNFTGECVYGVRGKDNHGNPVEVVKHYSSPHDGHDPLDRFDQTDFMLVRRIMKEWEFFWRSAPRPKRRSYGSISFIQYLYTPATVNVGYEYGSVETFEYSGTSSNYSNGVPIPDADTAKR